MKSLIVLVSLLGVAVSRPSIGHVQFANDGRSYSYSFETPVVQTLFHQARYLQGVPAVSAVPVSHAASVFVGPAVRYSYGAVPIAAVKHVEPANIQVSTDGFVLDTPEVAQATAEHLAAVAQAGSAALTTSTSDYEPINVPDDGAPVVAARAQVHYEPANIQVSPDGFVLDTYEVAQAKLDHLARFGAEAARSSNSVSYSSPNYVSYGVVQPVHNYAAPVVAAKHVQIADIKVSADGHVLDTPEVAQAKADHFAQYANDAARAAAAGGDESGSYNDESGSYNDESVSVHDSDSVSVVALRGEAQVAPVAYRVDDPPADIKVSSDGFVLDTPEVARAKSAHLAELARSNSQATVTYTAPATVASYAAYVSPSVAYTSPAVAYTTIPAAHAQPKWLGPEADIRVRSDGYLEDTPEVQHARAEHLATRASIMANTQAESTVAGATVRYAGGYTAQGGQYLLDTPEVVAARAAHLQAHAAEAAKAAVSVKTHNYGQLVYRAPVYHRTLAPAYSYVYSSPAYRYLSYRYAPTATPVALTPDGQYLLDTPEVAAAKADHFAAHARARGY